MPARVASSRSARTRAPQRRAPPAADEIPAATSPAPEPSPPPPVTYTPLQDAIATIFQSAQKTTAGHRKLVITMRSIWEQCAAGTGPLGASIGGGRVGEKAFVREFTGFLNRVLVIKKSEVVGDRCLRFTDLFVRGLLDKDKAKKKGGEDEQMIEEEVVEETSAIRFVLRFIFYLLPLISSREKTVRYRTTQLLSLLLANALPEFPYDYSTKSNAIFKQLRSELLKRIKDKETPVRVQAVVGVIKLLEMGVGTDEGDSEDDGEEGDGNVLAVLIEAMQNDPSADVRRTILYNINPTSETLPYLLERTRDTDPATRRSVFTRLLPSLGDFRHLSIGMREKLLRWGLNDRDESVREAARRMFNFRWLEDVDGDVIEILERLDVTSDGPQGGVKELALRGFWEERKDFVEKITFGDEFWEDLTAESAFLARSYNDYCRDLPSAQREAGEIDEKMPEVTKLALHLQKYLNKLVVALESEDAEAATWEFVAEQLLMIASRMDYGDEIGRRKMFALLRESLAIPELPEGVTKLIVECLAKLSMGEGDFCMLILEVIAEVHDRIADDDDEAGAADESFHSAKSDVSDDDDLEDSITVRAVSVKASTPAAKAAPSARKRSKSRPAGEDEDTDMMDIDGTEGNGEEEEQEGEGEDEDEEARAVKELMINLKCLHIAQCMLENVSGSLKKNTHLVTMLNGLVVPAVRSHEAPVRERGLRCLGLSCLLDKTLAEENLTLFAHCFNKGHEALQIEALHIMSDILVTHGSAIFEGDSCAVEQRTLYRMFAKALKLDEVAEVQATATEVVCKLMLAQVIKDEELLKVLVIAYFDSTTADNQSLRQILTYFLPVYCHSRPENQTRMQKITVNTIHQLLLIRENLGEEEEMVSITTTTSQMVDWTDPRKNVGGGVQAGRSGIEEKIVDPNVHVDLAIDTLERVSSSSCNKEEKKVLCAMLGKLYIPAEATPEKLRELYELVAQAIEDRVATDAPSRNALNKLELSLGKIVNELERDGATEATGDELAATGDEAEAAAGEATAGEASDDDEGDDTIVMTKPPRVDDLASEAGRETSAAPSTEVEEQEGEGGDEDEE